MPKKKAKSAKLIPAVGYLRKSTRGKYKGRERQEKSIAQQKQTLLKLADGRYEIVGWFADEGVSGWKRGLQRPDFARMLAEVERLGAQAVLCDNLDRFSRAAVDEVQEDANTLRKAGVRYIVTASHGTYDLGDRYDIGEILKFVVAVWASCEYSRQLSRRITRVQREAAERGDRSGSPAPYGWQSDGNHGLKFGDRKQIRIVREIYDRAALLESASSIADDLNKRGIPSSHGGLWGPKAVLSLLRNPVYRGDYVRGRKPCGKYRDHDIEGNGKVYRQKNRYKPMVDPKLWDRVNKHLKTLANNRARRHQRYALAGILFCGHCDAPLFGSTQGGHVYYKCSGKSNWGPGACPAPGWPGIREDRILPWLLGKLGDEIKKLLTEPPDHLTKPPRGHRKTLERDCEHLRKQIERGVRNLYEASDENRADIDRLLKADRAELARLEAELADEEPRVLGRTRADDLVILDWWKEFRERAVITRVDGPLPHAVAAFWQDPFSDSGHAEIMLDPNVVRSGLTEAGARVTLRWKSETPNNGRKRAKHELLDARYQLGQKRGKAPICAGGLGSAKVM